MFQIFNPFKKVTKNSTVFICSWGISPISGMTEVINNVRRAKKVQLIVGYSKQSHDLNKLKEILLSYKKLGWVVKAAPGLHAKIWLIDNEAHVGSANFCPDTINNYAVKVKITPRLRKFVDSQWKRGSNINDGTKLWLLPGK